MKHTKLFFLLILSLPTLFSCGNKPEPTPTDLCTVTFDANSGHFVDSPKTSFSVSKGALLKTIEIPQATDDSSTYVGWATDKNGKNSVTYDYQIDSDVTFYAQYSNVDLVVDDPLDENILCYGSTAIGYHLFDLNKTVTVSSSNPSVLDVSVDSAHSAVIVDAASANIASSANVVVSAQSSSVEVKHPISVYYPTTIQQAAESFDFALGRGMDDVTLTFNFNNSVGYWDFYNERLETRLSMDGIYEQQWYTGVNKTNHIRFHRSELMATKSSDIKTQHKNYYYENVKNAAYELRHSKIQKRTGNHFAIDDVKKRLVVHNSETLFFALERGYRPEFVASEIAVKDSVAQRAYQVYQKAREACADAFGNETTDNLMKVRQLFEWLVDNTHYDHWIVSSDFYEDDFYNWSSYFPEGVFLNNGIAVCDGFSKALAIMGGIEGLPIIRSAGFAGNSGHAWNYYKHSDERWYLICPTWAHNDNDSNEYFNYNFSSMTYQPFMAQSNYFYAHTYQAAYNYYISQGYSDYNAKVAAAKNAEQSNYKEVLFSDITKSNKPLVENIYTTDVFDKTKGYNFDLNSNAEAAALGDALPVMNKDFCINLSFDSWDYWEELVKKIYARMPNIDLNRSYISADYSFTDCTIYIKF